jgi:hypothetical protein
MAFDLDELVLCRTEDKLLLLHVENFGDSCDMFLFEYDICQM